MLDACLGDPDASRLRDALERRDWRSAGDFLNSVTDPDHRAFYLGICQAAPGVQEWIDEWVAAEPDVTLPVLVQGTNGIQWAWDARGRARASHTTARQFREFHRRLKIAEDSLRDVARRDPDDVDAWSGLVTTARGLELGKTEAWRRFDEVTSRHPLHVYAHEQMLQGLCAKWYGSDKEMFSFARKAVTKSPEGNPLGHLVAVAHIEFWSGNGQDNHLSRSEVRAELHAAANRSVRHADYRAKLGGQVSHNWFALAFSLAGDHTAAREHFEVIGRSLTPSPWQLFDDPVGMFRKMRATARKRG
ncbi:hypothetical protein [Planotetraspora kaengkrachanensis]|uniref:DUF4034 domain-containing protein n=1 Tax=Planotetraspora kaengkrachanensis TaxID=575193 RepID=A0A8J3Q0N7_9ACTN|nr:hypothetical protein [Planotetraspora kaengkrachanensis]GIG84534.1 hypothetical protein Pka01_76610 [Planotetraspora kaengkrachanensis]